MGASRVSSLQTMYNLTNKGHALNRKGEITKAETCIFDWRQITKDPSDAIILDAKLDLK